LPNILTIARKSKVKEKKMNMKKISILFLLISLLCGYAAAQPVSLMKAIELSAEKIDGELPKGSRIAIIAFESENENLSNFIMEELTGELVDRGFEVADRQNLDYVKKELNFQQSGAVDSSQALKLGQFIGADMSITGQLINAGSSYRYRTTAIRTEKGSHTSAVRLDVLNDADMKSMIATLAKQVTKVTVAKDLMDDAVLNTFGGYLDRGIAHLRNDNYVKAIADFEAALRIDPDNENVKQLLERAKQKRGK
jgi:tetratricopeptide (TPR) repeat protein